MQQARETGQSFSVSLRELTAKRWAIPVVYERREGGAAGRGGVGAETLHHVSMRRVARGGGSGGGWGGGGAETLLHDSGSAYTGPLSAKQTLTATECKSAVRICPRDGERM